MVSLTHATGRAVDSGEYLGSHVWDEEVIRETRGEFLFSHVRIPNRFILIPWTDLLAFLSDAIARGLEETAP